MRAAHEWSPPRRQIFRRAFEQMFEFALQHSGLAGLRARGHTTRRLLTRGHGFLQAEGSESLEKKGRSVAGRLFSIGATVKGDCSWQTCHPFAQPQDPQTTSAGIWKCHLLLAMADFHNHVEKLD